jgi:hypothetical protein
MIRYVLLTLLAALLAQPAFAHGGDFKDHADRMTRELQLTDAQQATVSAIMKEQHDKMREVFKSDLAHDAKRDRLKALREETHARLKAELTAEQAQRLDELHARRKDHKGGGHGPLDEQARTELGLNEDQSKAVDKIFEEHRQKKQQLRSSGAADDEMRKQKDALRDETKQKLATVLSEEQMRRFEERMEQRHRGHGRDDAAKKK